MRRLALIPSLLLSSAALADVPSVATDIAPVHGLVSMVMEGLGTPTLLVEPGASPHGYALRPSQAAALQSADAVFWIGHELAPWLEAPLDTLAGRAEIVALLETEGTVVHGFRETALFAQDDHDDHDDHDHEDHAQDDHDDHDDHDHEDHEQDEHDDHGHDDHDDHGHDDHDDHETADDHDDHDHAGIDPHAWLDPENGRVWLGSIAETLAELDPENAATYRANADRAQAELAVLSDQVAQRLSPLSDRSFVVFHDAYQYFESRFGLSGAGAISMSDASSPSAARVAQIRDAVADQNVVCIFAEPQFNLGLVATVAGTAELNSGIIDPLGTQIELGAGFYPALITSIAASVEDCLTVD